MKDKPDPIPGYGQFIGFNLDIGHYVAGTKFIMGRIMRAEVLKLTPKAAKRKAA